MGKSFFWRAWVLAVSVGAFLTICPEKDAMAEVNVGINIDLPSPFVFPAPPPVVVIPGTYVYMVPDVDVQVLFYHGHWYRPHGSRWFRSRSHSGPWVHIGPKHVPRALVGLPPHVHHIPPGHRRIPHGHLKANWAHWERDKHWKKDKAWQAEWKGSEGGKHPKKERGRDHLGKQGGGKHEGGKHGGKRD